MAAKQQATEREYQRTAARPLPRPSRPAARPINSARYETPEINGGGGAALARWLDNLGRLPAGFEGEKLLPFLSHENEKVRALAAVNLGKMGDIKFLPQLQKIACGDSSTMARREAVSAIGRMRDKAAIPALARLTKDGDPKVVLQALRGLLAFKQKNKTIHAALENLRRHPNELIQETIERERTFDFDTPKSKSHQTESPDFMKNLVVEGDVLQTLKKTPAESVHLTFTSPPYYNARDYSIYASYAEYLNFLQKVFRQVHRITKPGRFFVLNTSPVIIPRLSRQHSSRRYAIPFDLHPILTKMGWDFIDDLVWAKPEASVKNRNGGFFQHRKPLAYKPNARTEYLMVYRKKHARLIDWNIRQYDMPRLQKSLVKGEYETSNVWDIDPTFDKTHSAVFPARLCQRVIQYYSFADDLVFDPFGGSGTLGRAAAAAGRYFFMTEISSAYINRMQEKFGQYENLFVPEVKFANAARFAALIKNGSPS
ncbi:MAG: DNA methyltransferase [Gammaproteobacteria bacterium]